MTEVNLLELLKSGAHFGHTTSRWNPKMKSYIYTVRNNIHILDLEKTKKAIEKAQKMLQDLGAAGGNLLIVGTKRQAKEVVQRIATGAGISFVSVRWLGGTFTNFKTIQKTIRKMEKLEEEVKSEDFEQRYIKKERLQKTRELEKLSKLFTGIKDMKKLPDCIYVVDANHDEIAVKEAKKSNIKVIGIADTNTDPGMLDVAIPANDDATKTIELITQLLVDSYVQGRSKMVTTSAAPVAAPNPKEQN